MNKSENISAKTARLVDILAANKLRSPFPRLEPAKVEAVEAHV
jgi:hypothetical protein